MEEAKRLFMEAAELGAVDAVAELWTLYMELEKVEAKACFEEVKRTGGLETLIMLGAHCDVALASEDSEDSDEL